jgi:hypothetical protein
MLVKIDLREEEDLDLTIGLPSILCADKEEVRRREEKDH